MPREAHHSRNWGGKRPGQGRPPGTTSKYQKANERRAIESGEHPVDFMLKIMRDKRNDLKLRMHACHAVLPYVAARLNAVDINVTSDLDTMSLTEKLAKVTQLHTNLLIENPDIELPVLELVDANVIDAVLIDE